MLQTVNKQIDEACASTVKCVRKRFVHDDLPVYSMIMARTHLRAFHYLFVVTFVIGGSACTRPITKNGPLLNYDGQSGYRLENIPPGPGNTDETFVVLLFSGGGTRAASVAYGVLQGLRDTVIPLHGVRRDIEKRDYIRLLDEVDVISSVSGGSFTAMYYALNRDAIFDGRFEKRFLTQNIQGRLLNLVFEPLNLLRIVYSVFDRTDLAADYYDREVFDHKTYGDLMAQGYRPFVVINAADMSRGERFEFTQDDFDLIGSELTTVPVSRAVAASSAFPVLLSPLRLQYHEGEPIDQAIAATLAPEDAHLRNRRRFRWARNLCSDSFDSSTEQPHLDAANHRYLYLLDGGVVDNLGSRWVIDEYRYGVLREKFNNGSIKKLVVIVVDAGTEEPNEIEKKNSAPGLFMMGMRAGEIGVYNYTTAMSAVLRLFLREQPAEAKKLHVQYEAEITKKCPECLPLAPPNGKPIETYLIEVNFRCIEDPKVCRRCLTMPTTLFLSKDDVETLIDVGKKCLAANPEFQKLVTDLSPRSTQQKE